MPTDPPEGEVQLHGPPQPPTVGQMQADHDRLLNRIGELIDGRIEEALTRAAHSDGFQGELKQMASVPAAAAAAGAAAAAARSPADALGFGWAKPLVNLTAAGLMFILFYQLLMGWQTQFVDLVRGLAAQGRADREMFQQGLQVQHDDSQRKWAAIEKNTSAVMAIQGEIKQNRELIRSQNDTLGELVKAVKGQKPTAELRPPPPAVPPDGPNGSAVPWPGWWPAGL